MFDQNLIAWDTSKVKTFHGLFFETSFNYDISPWNISNVASLNYMFLGAAAFNQVLCWDLTGKVTSGMFSSSPGSASTTAAKCSCIAGEYYDTNASVCSACSSGYISYGQTESCLDCSSGHSSLDGTACLTFQPTVSPLPTVMPPTPAPSPAPVQVPTRAPTTTPAYGTCFSQESTASVLLPGSRFAKNLPLYKLDAGTRVLAADSNNMKTYAKVMKVHHIPASEPYLAIRVAMESKHFSTPQAHVLNPFTNKFVHADHTDRSTAKHLRVTTHHTFPVCHEQKLIPAHALKVGDCLHTAGGRGKVESIVPSPATKKDVTYTLVMEDSIDLVSIGGVFTKAKPAHNLPSKSLIRGSKHVFVK